MNTNHRDMYVTLCTCMVCTGMVCTGMVCTGVVYDSLSNIPFCEVVDDAPKRPSLVSY